MSAMNDQLIFPDPDGELSQISDWISFADDVFEAANPDVDVFAVLMHVLRVATEHGAAEVRSDAFRALQRGLVNHFSPRISLRKVAERLQNLQGEELLLALNVIGLSGDKTLCVYLSPFLTHVDRSVRAEADEARAALEVETQNPSVS